MKNGLVLGSNLQEITFHLGVLEALYDSKVINDIEYVSTTNKATVFAPLLLSEKGIKDLNKTIRSLYESKVFSKYKEDLKSKQDYLIKTISEYLDIKDKKKKLRYTYINQVRVQNINTLINQITTDTQEIIYIDVKKDSDSLILALNSIFGNNENRMEKNIYVDASTIDPYPIKPLIDRECKCIFVASVNMDFNPYLFDNLNVSFVLIDANKHNIYNEIDIEFNEKIFIDEYEKIGYINTMKMINKLKHNNIIKGIFNKKIINKSNFSVESL